MRSIRARWGKFLWSGFAAMMAIGLTSSMVLGRSALHGQERQARARAEHFAGAQLRRLLTPAYVEQPAAGARYRNLVAAVQDWIATNDRVARVRLWQPDGRLLFSTDARDRVGKRFNGELDFIRPASRGTTVGVVTQEEVAPKGGLAGSTDRLYRSFAPLEIAGRAGPQGAVEIDEYHLALESAATHPWRNLTIGFGVGILLACGLAFVSARGHGRKPRAARREQKGTAEVARQRERADRAEARLKELEERRPTDGTQPAAEERFAAEVREARRQAAALEAALREAQAKAASSAAAVGRVGTLERELAEARERLESSGVYYQGLTDQLAQAKQERETLEARLAEALSKLEDSGALSTEVLAAQERAEEAEAKLAEAEAKLQGAKRRARETRKRGMVVEPVPLDANEAPSPEAPPVPQPAEDVVAELKSRLARTSAHRFFDGGPPDPEEASPTSKVTRALEAAVLAEIRAPVSSIMGLSLSMKSAGRSAEEVELGKQLNAHAKRIDRLVADLQDVGRLAEGTIELKRRRTDLDALVRRVVSDSESVTDRAVEIQGASPSVAVDPGRVEQIISGLLANAVARTEPGWRIWVRLSDMDGGALLAVDDLAQEETSKGGSQLVLAQRLTELHGGRLWPEKRPDGGMSFRVFLPGDADVPDGESLPRALESAAE